MKPRVLDQFLNSIADAGKEMLFRGSNDRRRDTGPLYEICRDLLSTRGEASGTALAREVAENYEAMHAPEKHAFFRMLLDEFGVDDEQIVECAHDYERRRDLRTLLALSAAVDSPRRELLRRINMAPNGTATIVRMRQELLALLPEHPELAYVAMDMQYLLASWFNRGFLSLRRIDWETSATILEKLIQYDTVQPIKNWKDLQNRLAVDRRCFAFFHPALPLDPLIFVEVALTNGMADAIGPLLDDGRVPVDLESVDTATFYSINNCQAGLAGIHFGNFLIKQVVMDLASEFEGIKTFCTLSPVPGFMEWLHELTGDPEHDAITPTERGRLQVLERADWFEDDTAAAALKPLLLRLCATYLLRAKRSSRPRDAVARFHLRNGARLQRINWLSDTSRKGISQSAGMLVNYVYAPKSIERNHERYVTAGQVAASADVKRLARR